MSLLGFRNIPIFPFRFQVKEASIKAKYHNYFLFFIYILLLKKIEEENGTLTNALHLTEAIRLISSKFDTFVETASILKKRNWLGWVVPENEAGPSKEAVTS